MRTDKIETWYCPKSKYSLNIFEIIQICDQLVPHLEKNLKASLSKRLDKMKLLFYEKNRNNSLSRIPLGCYNDYANPNAF